ncbi:hypothetical protein FCULG_00006996 [Fusarium culmorum]|uniref:Uncharacterized protein n=1 Tax=Fusarium culmorum TaxID=5516 RepID=A0A2T4GW26_FUSCU|nr:hypothetical protein FCULG_00006996 [Fusarium culmorum]
MSGAIDSVIEDGKSLYQVFLQKDTDPSEVVDLIKSTVRHDYISPRSDADDASIFAQFKAMSSQIAKVKDHKAIVRVIKVEFPVQDIITPRGRRSFAESNYYIRPINGENVDQCNATGVILKIILEDQIGKPMMRDGKVSKWRASITDEQIVKVEDLDGVRVSPRTYQVRRKETSPPLLHWLP